MSKKTFRYQHIYSTVKDKAPSATTMLEGEIAVNAFPDEEKLFIKNASGNVVDFPRSYSIKDIDEDMEVIAAALNELNDRKADWISAVTSGSVVESESASTIEFYNKGGDMLFTIDMPENGNIDSELDKDSKNPVANSAITIAMEDAEYVISMALNELNDEKADWISAVTSGSVVESESASTMEFYNKYGDKMFEMPFPEGADVDKDFNSGSTKALANSAITVTIQEIEKVTSAALNDLNQRKLDASAYTLGVYEELFVTNGEASATTSGVTLEYGNISGDTLFDINIETDDVVNETKSKSVNPVQTKAVYEAMDGLKMKKVTQEEYDEMEQQGTLDRYTIYFIIEEE